MLELLLNKYGSDKASKHHYHKVYEAEFDGMRNLPINFLEIGIGRGQCIEAMIDFFPNANFYAIDTFRRIDPKDIPVLKNQYVKWARCDPAKTITRELIDTIWSGVKFDIILDNGVHTPRANGQTFNVFYPYLNDEGMYFIESVWPLHIMNEEEKEHSWIQKHPEDYSKLEMDYFMEQIPYATKATEFDLRASSGYPDSYIIKIDK